MKIRAIGLMGGVAHYARYFCIDRCRFYFSSCTCVTNCVPGEALMWLLSQGLPHQLCTLHLLSNSIIHVYISVQYTLLHCAIMTALSLRKIPFYISGQYRAEDANTAVCTPDFAVLPSALSGSPH